MTHNMYIVHRGAKASRLLVGLPLFRYVFYILHRAAVLVKAKSKKPQSGTHMYMQLDFLSLQRRSTPLAFFCFAQRCLPLRCTVCHPQLPLKPQWLNNCTAWLPRIRTCLSKISILQLVSVISNKVAVDRYLHASQTSIPKLVSGRAWSVRYSECSAAICRKYSIVTDNVQSDTIRGINKLIRVSDLSPTAQPAPLRMRVLRTINYSKMLGQNH